jgi:hypothetical protein
MHSLTSHPSLQILKLFHQQSNALKDYNNFHMCYLECKNCANFPQSVRIVSFSVNFCIVISIVKEVNNVKRSVMFECVTVDGCEKLFSSCPVNYDIRSHYGVTEN